MCRFIPLLTVAALLAGSPPVPGARAAAPAADPMANMHMDGTGYHTHADAAHFPFGAPAPADRATRTVEITMNAMTFEPATIDVQAGETVRFVVTNASTIDHEFTLGDEATERAHRAEMAEMMARGERMAHDDPNAMTVAPGQTGELTWAFGSAGPLEYDCNIPGHAESGMKGHIAVR